MDAKFISDDAKMNVDYEPNLTTIEVWNVDHWNVMHLSDGQRDELIRFLNATKE